VRDTHFSSFWRQGNFFRTRISLYNQCRRIEQFLSMAIQHVYLGVFAYIWIFVRALRCVYWRGVAFHRGSVLATCSFQIAYFR
jgi:hypothetical protein